MWTGSELIPFALNVKRPTAQVVMHVIGCASVDHARLWKVRFESEDFSGKDPTRNNVWVELDAAIGPQQADGIAAVAGPMFFPTRRTKPVTGW
jgi:hypothetical protein